MKLIDNLGLKNFRIFDDKDGFFEEMASINILIGANNSGKSTIIKSLQMLKNSVKEGNPVFDLDLTNQEHLLGDFDNVLYNKSNKSVEISLPFTFLGLTNLYASLAFDVQDVPNNYKAKLRCLKILDNVNNSVLFSFSYREASMQEKNEHLEDFENERIENEENMREAAETKDDNSFSPNNFWFSFPHDPLIGFIDWTINADKLKLELKKVLDFYKMYLENYDGDIWLDTMDETAEKGNMPFVPSLLISSFKNNVSIDEWEVFVSSLPLSAISGNKEICDGDFEVDDFAPVPTIEDLLYYRSLEILRKNFDWLSIDKEKDTYNVIENCFKSAWNGVHQRISTVNYVSAVKEQNSRIYHAAGDSHFINLLKDFQKYNLRQSHYLRHYLEMFEIGKMIEVEYQLQYQLISVNVTTLDGVKRELVDFGYGIKQLILILIQICVLAEKSKRTRVNYNNDGPFYRDYHIPSLLIIEEPEANLHPKWQSLLAELFVKANEKFNIQFVIESHSEYLIRKFQNLVASKQFDGNKIKIFYLRNNQKSINQERMSSLHIEEDGSIDYMLFDSGFFDEGDNLELSLLNIQRINFFNDFNTLRNQKASDEAKIINLESRIDAYVGKLDLHFSAQLIVQQFHTSKLFDLTVKYLSSGQYLLNNITNEDDYSPAILQFGRAVENEMKQLFLSVDPGEKWMMGVMQGTLEKFKFGASILPACSNAAFEQLKIELAIRFDNPLNLKMELIQDLRDIRNSVAHAGESKTKQDALIYYQTAKEFLESWISEKK